MQQYPGRFQAIRSITSYPDEAVKSSVKRAALVVQLTEWITKTTDHYDDSQMKEIKTFCGDDFGYVRASSRIVWRASFLNVYAAWLRSIAGWSLFPLTITCPLQRPPPMVFFPPGYHNPLLLPSFQSDP
jgi:hypothetical protein